jgi:N-acetyl-1-D-myo-inositol-2-amino-2-deoxy-alpha-D-glucopyranoside deacetylase
VPAPPAPLAGRALLTVFAHPDDESLACGGLLAWCAALGARVSILCLTRGEHGSRTPSYVETELDPSPSLAALRTAELAAAARTLGAAEITVLDHEDGMLPWIDPATLESNILDATRRVRPDVVVTFDEDGLYWHPDHIAVHARTTAAIAALGAEAPALYYVTMPPGAMRGVVDAAAGRRPAGGPPLTVLGIANPDAFGADAAPPTLVVDAGAFAARKLAAIRCHRTQVAGDALDLLTDDDAVRCLGVEHFRRAAAGSRGDAFIEHLSDARIPA